MSAAADRGARGGPTSTGRGRRASGLEYRVGPGRWLDSYAGFLTLLLAVFIVLFAGSRADPGKLREEARSLGQALAPVGRHGGRETNPDILPFPVSARDRALNPAGGTPPGAQPPQAAGNARELGQLEASFRAELGPEALMPEGERGARVYDVDTRMEDQGLLIRIAAEDFFDSGSATVRPELRPVLDRIGRKLALALREHPRAVRIEGHTDAEEDARLESPGGSHASGWDLSSARASGVLRDWVSRLGIDPARLSAVGRSHYRPLVTRGKTDWGRGRNRRIEIVLPFFDGAGTTGAEDEVERMARPAGSQPESPEGHP